MTLAHSPSVAQDYGAGYQTPSLQAIDHAIIYASRAGDTDRRNALMELRCTVVLADLCAALADAVTAQGGTPMTPAAAPVTSRSRRVVQLAATVRHDRPEYRYVGGGRFEPANLLAQEECAGFNGWVDDVNARSAKGGRP